VVLLKGQRLILILMGRTTFALQGVFVLRQILILGLLLAPLYGRTQTPPLSQSPATAAVPASATVTAIRAGRLLDVESGRTLLNQIILVAGGRIQTVGTGVEIPNGAKVIDLSGMTRTSWAH
jgi:predicted lipid-binding transport protein (Tim44 family)